MIALVEDNRDAIVALCERFGVRRLALFGSAAKGTFDPATSDLVSLHELSILRRQILLGIQMRFPSKIQVFELSE